MSDIKEFWEKQHRNDKQLWLTGTSLHDILRFYSLSNQDLENKKFLEIGIGLATVTRSLSKAVSELYCADISAQALERAKPHAKGVWLSPEIDQIPAVDMALCHLVLVHCDDAECERILRSINLAPGGKIYCQFSCLTHPKALDDASPDVKKDLVDSGMHFFRSEDEIENIIDRAGLQIVDSTKRNPGSYRGWNGQYWKFYQLEKQTEL